MGAAAWLTLGLIGYLGGVVAVANEAQEGKLTRLGYAYDEQVHAAAVLAGRTRQKNDGVGGDAPPDGVVRLPKYVVSGERVPLEEHEILTQKGRVEEAKKRYLNRGYQKTLGLVAGVATFLNDLNHGWRPNSPEAMALYWDAERTRRIGAMRDLTELAALSEKLKPPPPVPARAEKWPKK